MKLYRSAVAVVVVTVLGLAACTSRSKDGAKQSSSASNAVGHEGGMLNLLTFDNPGSVDTAINYGTAWAEENVVYDGLMAYKKTAGAAGTQLVPDLASAMPVVSDGGKTYTFPLRPNITYSDGTTLKPSDVTNTFERMLVMMGS